MNISRSMEACSEVCLDLMFSNEVLSEVNKVADCDIGLASSTSYFNHNSPFADNNRPALNTKLWLFVPVHHCAELCIAHVNSDALTITSPNSHVAQNQQVCSLPALSCLVLYNVCKSVAE